VLKTPKLSTLEVQRLEKKTTDSLIAVLAQNEQMFGL
jgi:hypothetical protein